MGSKEDIEDAYKTVVEENTIPPLFKSEGVTDAGICFTIPEGGYINHITPAPSSVAI